MFSTELVSPCWRSDCPPGSLMLTPARCDSASLAVMTEAYSHVGTRKTVAGDRSSPTTVPGRIRLEECDALHVRGHRKGVEAARSGEPVPAGDECGDVPGERSRVAGDVHDRPGPGARQQPADGL